jgi:hypothetical protein
LKKDKEYRDRKKLHCKKFRYLRRSPGVVIIAKSRGYDGLHGTRTNVRRTSMWIRLRNKSLKITRRKQINVRIILKRLL